LGPVTVQAPGAYGTIGMSAVSVTQLVPAATEQRLLSLLLACAKAHPL